MPITSRPSDRKWLLFRIASFCAILASAVDATAQADLVPFNELGLRVARGFRVSLYADSDLANDIYAMTLDARGDVVVTGRGYIRTLVDTDNDGFADARSEFATTGSGGMGMCFDGDDLYFTGDGYFSRYRDANGDSVADGPPERIVPLAFGEHGGHAPRKGPDGWWYVIGGNDTGFGERHVTIESSPVRKPQAGALMRVWPDGGPCEVVAHGFRNPYDFDFNWIGDLFTYDSDVERDFFLPWYTPTRLYHIGHGAHHGWQLNGYQRSWNRADYYIDTVRMLAPIGRGSPTGVTVYRHHQFPQRYRGGLFTLDWTFGRIHFTPLEAEGATYAGAPEVFLEPIGTHGFAPTDLAVAPDGSMFVSIGGRKTRGAVYRIEYVAGASRAIFATNWMRTVGSPVDEVLAAPQPLEAWSRAWWVPRAQRLGARPFVTAAVNSRLAPGLRVRAVEILTEFFNGLSVENARAGAAADSPFVRARVAWSLGRLANREFGPIISTLAADADPLVRRCALEALLDRADEVTPERVLDAVMANSAHPEQRIRQLAANLASRLPDPAWNTFWKNSNHRTPQAQLTAALAAAWRGPLPQSQVIETALAVLAQSKTPAHQLEALRLIALGLGDWNLTNASVEVYTAYENPPGHRLPAELLQKVTSAVAPIVPAPIPEVNAEAARVLAMLNANAPKARDTIIGLITDQSSPMADFHYLIVLSRMGRDAAPSAADFSTKVANAIVSLDRKLVGRQQRIKQSWTFRLVELVEQLVRRDPAVADAILRHPDFVRPAHVPLANALGPGRRLAAARMFARAAERNPRFEWSGPLIELLASLPVAEVRDLLRKQWSNIALRDDLVLKLAESPEAADREKFLAGLTSPQTNVVQASVRALNQLPVDRSGRVTLAAVRLLRRLLGEPAQTELRQEVVQLINHNTDEAFAIGETTTDVESLRRLYQPIFDWFSQAHPKLVPYLTADDSSDNPTQWAQVLRSVPWNQGDAGRGAHVYEQRGCHTCHSGAAPLGPDLGGVAKRFSPLDLFTAIIFPNRDVAPAYRATVVQTRTGQTHTGMLVFESADGVIVQTGATTTVRLANDDIVSRKLSTVSLMPSGLLAGLQPSDLADLYQYLKSLPAPGN